MVEETRKGKEAERSLAAELEQQLLRFREQEQRLKTELETEVGRGRATEVLLQRKLDEERVRCKETDARLSAQLAALGAEHRVAKETLAGQLQGMRIGATALEARRTLEEENQALRKRLADAHAAMADGGSLETANYGLRGEVAALRDTVAALQAELHDLVQSRDMDAAADALTRADAERDAVARARHAAEVDARRRAAEEAMRAQEEAAEAAAVAAQAEAVRRQAMARERAEAAASEAEAARRSAALAADAALQAAARAEAEQRAQYARTTAQLNAAKAARADEDAALQAALLEQQPRGWTGASPATGEASLPAVEAPPPAVGDAAVETSSPRADGGLPPLASSMRSKPQRSRPLR